MAQYDICRLNSGSTLVLDCQSDLLDQLETRFVIPLIAKNTAPIPAKRLNPSFIVKDQELILFPQFAATIRTSEIAAIIGSLADQNIEIDNAIDMLLSGF